jgi:hypothetical protein
MRVVEPANRRPAPRAYRPEEAWASQAPPTRWSALAVTRRAADDGGIHPGTDMPTIKGRFEIRRTPHPMLDLGGGAQAMHMRFDKRFEGDLSAASVVHMLAVGTAVEGSAAYVAVERVEGELEGRAGSFLLRHCGTMERGAPTLDLAVVPDSAYGALAGLSGTMKIDIVEGEHFYTFDYALR